MSKRLGWYFLLDLFMNQLCLKWYLQIMGRLINLRVWKAYVCCDVKAVFQIYLWFCLPKVGLFDRIEWFSLDWDLYMFFFVVFDLLGWSDCFSCIDLRLNVCLRGQVDNSYGGFFHMFEVKFANYVEAEAYQLVCLECLCTL